MGVGIAVEATGSRALIDPGEAKPVGRGPTHGRRIFGSHAPRLQGH